MQPIPTPLVANVVITNAIVTASRDAHREPGNTPGEHLPPLASATCRKCPCRLAVGFGVHVPV
jgi:hypothetical protein